VVSAVQVAREHQILIQVRQSLMQVAVVVVVEVPLVLLVVLVAAETVAVGSQEIQLRESLEQQI
jgi:hypothetical protein